MIVREVTNADMPEIQRWWIKQSWPELCAEMLPKTGFVVEKPGVLLAAGWLYLTDSCISWAEWIVGNPDAEKSMRRAALDLIIKSLISAAQEAEKPIIFSCMKHKGLIERMTSHGFHVTNPDAQELIFNGRSHS